MCIRDRDVRGRGIATQIMEQALEVCKGRAAALDPTTQVARVSLNAQTQAQDFYAKFGFQPVGEPFDEEGIPHVTMELKL